MTDGSNVYLTETYKGGWPDFVGADARTHLVPRELIDFLFKQRSIATISSDTIIADFAPCSPPAYRNATLPVGSLPDFSKYPVYRYGWSFDGWLHQVSNTSILTSPPTTVQIRTLLSTSAVDGTDGIDSTAAVGSSGSINLSRDTNGTTTLSMVDSNGVSVVATTDWVCAARLASSGRHHICVIADAGPMMVTWVVDGHVCDGGPMDSSGSGGTNKGTSAGWVLFDQSGLGDVGGGKSPVVATAGAAVIEGHIYKSALHVTECIGNWRSGFTRHRTARK